jgi:hypothetical protein
LQEFWDICHSEDSGEGITDESGSSDAQVLLALSVSALSGKSAVNAIQFQGLVQGIPAHILLDSGSSHTFVSASFAARLQGQTSFSPSIQVKIADGQFLSCSTEFKHLEWSMQQCTFQSCAKVIPLAQYDFILGMDWLSHFSPMEVDWRHKWLKIPYAAASRLLQGDLHDLPPGSVVQVSLISTASSSSQTDGLPTEFAQLLQDFQSVFTPLAGYPPQRECEHDIPLLPGATPVSVRPYRYPPAVKDEIERQIADMLSSGIVQHSHSPFSSSVLLVKKKDGTFRFCVDFRQLNAITIKSKYPVPVIEELLDELHGASWFTSLDLAAGYHQIRLKPGEEAKTAFQTHTGHYEFRVMAFGLTGAPATFLKAMNLTLGPLLRKCVLVFFDDILIFSHTYEDHVQHVRQVLEVLRRDQWQVKMSKCAFA